MSVETDSSRPNPGKGLPPVVPPTGRMIAQLFIVPGLIVAVAVTVLLGFSWLAGGPRTADGFLDHLKNPNVDVRWRAASDLAQILKRDESLATDVGFGLDLADMLRDAAKELRVEEQVRAATDKSGRGETLGRRSTVQYLAACLGNFRVPVGAADLADLARGPVSRDPNTEALLRRQAIWALANLGDAVRRFPELGETRRAEVVRKLGEASAGTGDRARAAAAAARILDGSSAEPVVAALVAASEADDPFLRQQSALALTFWFGSAEENARIEEALVRLARDSGYGTSLRVSERD